MKKPEDHTHLGELDIESVRRELVAALAVASRTGEDVYERLAACEERVRRALAILVGSGGAVSA